MDINKIQFMRGGHQTIPSRLDYGEPAFTTDTYQFYIGTDDGKVEITRRPITTGDFVEGRYDKERTITAAFIRDVVYKKISDEKEYLEQEIEDAVANTSIDGSTILRNQQGNLRVGIINKDQVDGLVLDLSNKADDIVELFDRLIAAENLLNQNSAAINQKVEKENGKSLIDVELITKLQTLIGAYEADDDSFVNKLEEVLMAFDQFAAGGTLVDALSQKIQKNSPITAGIGTKFTVDSKGLVTAISNLSAADIPDLSAAQITGGIFSDALIPKSTEAQTAAGISDTTFMTPAKVAKAISAAKIDGGEWD